MLLKSIDDRDSNDRRQYEELYPEYVLIVKYLLDHGANVHAEDNQALISAATFGYLQIFQCLIDGGADIHARDDDAIVLASTYGHLEMVEYLLNRDADVRLAIIGAADACFYGDEDLELIKFLFEKCLIYAADKESTTEISASIHYRIVRFITKNVDTINEAVRRASRKGNVLFLKYLVELGANIHVSDIIGASSGGNVEMVKYLIEQGLDIYAQDGMGSRRATLYGKVFDRKSRRLNE